MFKGVSLLFKIGAGITTKSVLQLSPVRAAAVVPIVPSPTAENVFPVIEKLYRSEEADHSIEQYPIEYPHNIIEKPSQCLI